MIAKGWQASLFALLSFVAGYAASVLREAVAPIARESHENVYVYTRPRVSWAGKGEHDEEWCPDATCAVAPPCAPCRRRFLILAASGRSASTTAQQMLHSLPGVRMTGENNDALGVIYTAMNKVRHSANFRRNNSAWMHHEVRDAAYACLAQRFLATFNPPPPGTIEHEDDETILGFKTIRLVNNRRNASRAARVVRENLPCSRVVVNYRSDVEAQIKSRKAAFHNKVKGDDVLRRELEERNHALRRLAKELGPRQSFLLDSSAWTRNVTRFNEMVAWLGFRDACAFERAFQYNTDDGGYGAGEVVGRAVPPGCLPLPLGKY